MYKYFNNEVTNLNNIFIIFPFLVVLLFIILKEATKGLENIYKRLEILLKIDEILNIT